MAARAEEPMDAELVAFVQGGVGIVVASRDDRLLASIARGVGCRVEEGGRRVTVFVVRSENAALLDDIRRHRVVAVVFSSPDSHRTVQLKGFDAREREAGADDARQLEAYARAFDEALTGIGFGHGYAGALIAHPPGDLVGVSFTVSEGYLQTPGPRAGERLAGQ
jgi:hypothetical protein